MTVSPDTAALSPTSLPGDELWQAVDALSEILIDSSNLGSACERALTFVMDALHRHAGVLVVQAATDPVPLIFTTANLPEAWSRRLDDQEGPLRQLMSRLIRVHTTQRSSPGELPEGMAAAVALMSRSDVQGVLILSGAPCSDDDNALLNALARPIARSIRQLRSRLTARKLDQELDALQAVVATLSFSSEAEEVQARMVQGICRTLQSDVGALILMDEDQGGLITKKTLNSAGQWIYQVSLEDSPSLIQECLRSGQQIRVNNLLVDPRFRPAFDSVPGLEARTMLCAPLIVRGQVLGAIQVINKQNSIYDADDQDLLLMIASVSGHSIYGTRLIQQLKVANADLEASHWELLRSRNTLRALFDSMPAALYIVDRKFRLVAINLSCAVRANKQPKTLVGQQCYEALYDRQDICPGCRVSATLFDGINTTRTERRWGESEDPTEWEVNSYPIADETDQVVQAILVEQDVTERRRLESIIAQSEKLAAVGQLAAGVAHEINNPLTAIIANAQLMLRDVHDDPEMIESLDLIIKAGNRATQVVRNLLDFARKEQYNLELTDINETIARALALAQHELLARSIGLSFEPATDLPMILASTDHLQGVWLNLVLNAVDAMDPTQQGMLRVTTRRIGNEIRIIVADNGKGIPPEKVSRIFEPFFTTKAPGRGTGLGLSVCHRIVKQHGGHILVDSKIGVGTEFTVVLPIS